MARAIPADIERSFNDGFRLLVYRDARNGGRIQERMKGAADRARAGHPAPGPGLIADLEQMRCVETRRRESADNEQRRKTE
jgi:hypothetical protein